MDSRTGKFLCVIPPKTLSIDREPGERNERVGKTDYDADDEKKKRKQYLREALEQIEYGNHKSTKELRGGGIAIGVGPNVQAFTDNEVIVSFVGHLTNADYLAWRLFSPEGRRGEDLTTTTTTTNANYISNTIANPLEATKKLIGGKCYEAELICHMYKQFGSQCLPKLRGKFAFACYDARTVRVFAARDASGEFALKFGRGADGTVVVSNFDGANELLPQDQSGMELKPQKFEDLPAGTYIYGHRSLIPRRFERTEETKAKEIDAAHDAVAEALRGIDLAKKSGRKSFDGEISGRPWMKANRDADSAGSSRKNSIDLPRESTTTTTTTTLSATAKPFDISKLDSLPEHDTPSPKVDEYAIGSEEEHRQAEAVAIKAAQAALNRVASGANMRGMVRMGSTHTLSLIDDGTPDSPAKRSSASVTDSPKMHRVASRSGLISGMVKVASYEELGNIGSFNDLIHAASSSKNEENKFAGGKRNASWVDLSMLVISGGADDDVEEKNDGEKKISDE